MSAQDPHLPMPGGHCGGPEIAVRALASGEAKAKLPFTPTLILGIMAGVYIGLGANFFTLVKTGVSLGFGLDQLIGGICFCLGLILVVVGGAELFTGNNLIAMAWFSRRVSTKALLRNWGIVYVGNFVGSLLLVGLIVISAQHSMAEGEVGLKAISIAIAKCRLSWSAVLVRGILCNALVCLAVWLCFSACSTTDKILAIIFPISAFVACGFEHCVANMYLVPMGIALKSVIPNAMPGGIEALTWGHFIVRNLIPSTIGNIIGGSVVVGGMYWVAYILPTMPGFKREVPGDGEDNGENCSVPK